MRRAPCDETAPTMRLFRACVRQFEVVRAKKSVSRPSLL